MLLYCGECYYGSGESTSAANLMNSIQFISYINVKNNLYNVCHIHRLLLVVMFDNNTLLTIFSINMCWFANYYNFFLWVNYYVLFIFSPISIVSYTTITTPLCLSFQKANLEVGWSTWGPDTAKSVTWKVWSLVTGQPTTAWCFQRGINGLWRLGQSSRIGKY